MLKKQRRKDASARTDSLVHAALAIVKGAAGLLTGSSALAADAVRSAAAAARAYVAAAGLRTAREPGRAAAPVHGGTGSTESAVNIAAALLFLVAGLEIAIHAVREMAEGTAGGIGWAASCASAAALAVRAAIVRRAEREELASAAVVIAGSGTAWLGGELALPLLANADALAALAVSLLVMVRGYRFVSGAHVGTTRIGFRDADVSVLSEAMLLVDGVIAVEELRAWEQGESVIVDTVVSVNPRISVLEGQEIAKRVKEQLRKRFMHVTDVYVRVDPYDPGYPYKSNHDTVLEQAPTLLQ